MADKNILIVGLGKVAIDYDLTGDSKGRKTHLFSIQNILDSNGTSYSLFGVDIDRNSRNKTVVVFPKMKVFSNLRSLPAVKFDIILICVPIDISFEVTMEVIDNLEFACLLLEKPGVGTRYQAELLNAILGKIEVAYILYPRRSLPSSRYLKQILSSYDYSEFKVEINYSGGSANILSHFVDFTEFIFGVDDMRPNDLLTRFKMRNTSLTNLGDHRITIMGPVRIDYSLGGGKIQVDVPGMATKNIESAEEIQSQIWYTTKIYLEVLSHSKILPFPSRVSQNIIEILEV